MDDIRPQGFHQPSYRDMPGDKREIEIFPAGRNHMFRDTVEHPVHGIVRYQVDFVPPACKIFSPALGMDAAAVGNKNDFHRGPPGYLCRPLRYVISSVVFPKKVQGYQHVRRIIATGAHICTVQQKKGRNPVVRDKSHRTCTTSDHPVPEDSAASSGTGSPLMSAMNFRRCGAASNWSRATWYAFPTSSCRYSSSMTRRQIL